MRGSNPSAMTVNGAFLLLALVAGCGDGAAGPLGADGTSWPDQAPLDMAQPTDAQPTDALPTDIQPADARPTDILPTDSQALMDAPPLDLGEELLSCDLGDDLPADLGDDLPPDLGDDRQDDRPADEGTDLPPQSDLAERADWPQADGPANEDLAVPEADLAGPEADAAQEDILTLPDALICDPDQERLALLEESLPLWLMEPPWNMVLGELEGPCRVVGHAFAASGGMDLLIQVAVAAPVAPRVQILNAHLMNGRQGAAVLADEVGAPGQGLALRLTLPYTGELMVALSDDDLQEGGAYSITITCEDHCDRAFTRFPIVLVHGFAGWDGLIDVYEYFFNVEDDLIDEGYDVHTTVAASFNDCATRAAMVADQIDDILEATGAAKVNLVAHSQGGLDSRYAISTLGYGDRIATLTMISTPNQGSKVADIILGDIPGFAQDILAAILDLIGLLLGTGSDQDIMASMEQLATSTIQREFNPQNPDDPRVTYWSYAGRSCGILEFDCIFENNWEVVDLLFSLTYELLQGDGENEGPNDGMVTVESARWGTFVGELSADHCDEIGQIMDYINLPFDHIQFYRNVAHRLYQYGF